MARDEMTSWLIGTSIPLRLTIERNGTKIDADSTPTIDVWDSAGVKQEDAKNMSKEATGEYIYYSDSTSWPVGKCFYVISYTVSTVNMKERSMFFTYDQATWEIIEKVRGALDNLQEGELSSGTIYEWYNMALREITPEAPATVDADVLADAIRVQTALYSYISYLTDRERAGDQIGTAAYIMLTELRLMVEKAMMKVKRVTYKKAEVTRGIFTTTESAMQHTEYKDMDPARQEASKEQS